MHFEESGYVDDDRQDGDDDEVDDQVTTTSLEMIQGFWFSSGCPLKLLLKLKDLIIFHFLDMHLHEGPFYGHSSHESRIYQQSESNPERLGGKLEHYL